MMVRALIVLAGLGPALLSAPLSSQAQSAGKVPRIGVLRSGSPPDPFVDAFRQGLRELGYVEGRNISIEYRWAEGKVERLPDLAADLVRVKVDVIVTNGSLVPTVKGASTTIPIVMPASNDPVGAGLVASLARPGGNVTGLAFLSEELPGKWMELLKELLPGVSRVAVLSVPSTDAVQLKASEAAARSLGLGLHTLTVRRSEDLGTAFVEAQKFRAEALMVLSSAFVGAQRTRIVSLAATHRLPTIYNEREFVASGGLISYGANLRELFRRAATYVDKILKGAKPADLPVEQPTKFELVINMKTAKMLGLTIPPSVLARADELIQ